MLRNLLGFMMSLNFKKQKGQGMVEYGLIIALVAVVVIVALTLLGGNIRNIFNQIAGELGGGQ
ncbi:MULTISPECIES: Flp family type IVb pilin [unclassified Caloramator]|uniref:Flp family type IVb pilin n=1 Tax=unclassified Caloramator TaxID=2629145 RepID=UPI00237E6213|nr:MULTISPECIES: Flp family type IVb pilin [unclassified Caloramator]MDO6355990.1 Flp family type IVb pilin [Caloramator sp. CAR-1]WDU82744.1 Flp family type IVb pilin [Caloramator sp. Dgby_cultured_2]